MANDAEAPERTHPEARLLGEFPPGRRLGRLSRLDPTAGEFPQAPEQPGVRAPLDEPSTRPLLDEDDRRSLVRLPERRSSGGDRPGVRKLVNGPAARRDRAVRAAGSMRRADRLPEFHHRLAERTGPVAREDRRQGGLQAGPGRESANVTGLERPPGGDADPVRFQRYDGPVEGEAGDRPGDVRADAGERLETLDGVREPARVLGHDRARGRMEVAGPRIVPRAFPGLQDGGKRGPRQRRDGRKLRHEPIVPVGRRGDPCLLEHHLGDPDPVRVPVATPRERPTVRREPGEQGRRDRGIEGDPRVRRGVPGRRASPRRRHEAHV